MTLAAVVLTTYIVCPQTNHNYFTFYIFYRVTLYILQHWNIFSSYRIIKFRFPYMLIIRPTLADVVHRTICWSFSRHFNSLQIIQKSSRTLYLAIFFGFILSNLQAIFSVFFFFLQVQNFFQVQIFFGLSLILWRGCFCTQLISSVG